MRCVLILLLSWATSALVVRSLLHLVDFSASGQCLMCDATDDPVPCPDVVEVSIFSSPPPPQISDNKIVPMKGPSTVDPKNQLCPHCILNPKTESTLSVDSNLAPAKHLAL